MRFGIKTSPQHTTWADMLAVWQAADDIELFESAWTFDHFYPIFSDDSTGPCLEGWVTLTALAQATTPDPGRRARHRHAVPPPGGARQHGGHARHRLRRAGSSSGSARAGTRRRPTRTGSTCTPLTERFDRVRRSVRGRSSGCSPNEPTDLRRPLLPARRRVLQPEAGAAAAPADLHRWRRANGARCDRSRAGPSTGTIRAAPSSSSRPSSTCCTRTAPTSAATRPRSRSRRTCRGSTSDVAEQAQRYGDAGLDLGIVYLQTPHTPDVLGEPTDALAPLAG